MSTNTNNVDSIVKRLVEDRTFTMSEYLNELRSQLLSDEPDQREESLSNIVGVITKLPDNFLNETQAGLLLDFLIGRLEDSALAGGSVIEGIKHLVLTNRNLPDGFEIPLFLSLFRDGNVQAWPQKERMKHYIILEWLLTNKETKLKLLGADVLLSFIKTVGGERDPRCLLIVFKLQLLVTKSFVVEPFSEDLFEVMACYYPVEFKPLPGQDSITKEMLAHACRTTLVAHNSFAPYCFLLIEEKFEEDDTTYDQKVELCNLIELAVNTFSLSSLLPFVPKLLGCIRSVGMDPRNKGPVELPVLAALKSIFSSLEKKNSSKLTDAVTGSLENSEMFVLQAEMGLSEKALLLLRVIAESAPSQKSAVFDQVLPWISSLVQGTTVNAAGNRIDICKEGLQFLREWISLARELKEEKTLDVYCDTIFASIDKAREYLPSLSIQCLYHCLMEYFRADCLNDIVKSRGKNVLENCFKTTESVEERAYLLRFITVYAEVLNDEVVEFLLASSYESEQKFFQVFCACIVNKKVWEKLIEKFRTILADVLNDEACLRYFISTLERLREGDAMEIVALEFINYVDKISTQSSLIEETLQSIGLLLSEETHQEISKKFSQNENFRLFSAQSTDPLIILEAIGVRVDDFVIPLVYAYINRTGTVSELSDELKNQKWFNFVQTKALLVSGVPDGLSNLKEIFHQMSIQKNIDIPKNIDLFDFKSNWFNPERSNTVRTVLWKQRIVCQSVPFYINAVVNAQDKTVLLELLPSVLESVAELGQSCNSQIQQFLPVFLAAAESDEKLASPVLKSLVSFLSGVPPELLDQSSAHKIIKKLCNEVQTSPMASCLDALKCLELIARRAKPQNLYPFISLVVESTANALGHKKRLIRQSTATVVNLWELLSTK
ncbi:unnamed protein product [Auanema sp. JU1783]|nr:unnamed protein product [Auanema sp. JU1783]